MNILWFRLPEWDTLWRDDTQWLVWNTLVNSRMEVSRGWEWWRSMGLSVDEVRLWRSEKWALAHWFLWSLRNDEWPRWRSSGLYWVLWIQGFIRIVRVKEVRRAVFWRFWFADWPQSCVSFWLLWMRNLLLFINQFWLLLRFLSKMWSLWIRLRPQDNRLFVWSVDGDLWSWKWFLWINWERILFFMLIFRLLRLFTLLFWFLWLVMRFCTLLRRFINRNFRSETFLWTLLRIFRGSWMR